MHFSSVALVWRGKHNTANNKKTHYDNCNLHQKELKLFERVGKLFSAKMEKIAVKELQSLSLSLAFSLYCIVAACQPDGNQRHFICLHRRWGRFSARFVRRFG
jgi:hypothetical protein